MKNSVIDEIGNRVDLGALSKPALVGIVVVIVMVAALTAGRLIEAATATNFAVSASAAPIDESNVSASQEPATIYVHVSGEVNNPGLCEVATGARVADAVQAAGGLTEKAAAESVNLARTLEDGEHVHISSSTEGSTGQSGETADEPGLAVSAGPSSGLVNINTASASELTALPGIGESTASKIVADRKANGSYKTVDDLKRVSGIGDKKFESIHDLICV